MILALLADLGTVFAVCTAAWVLGRGWRWAVGLGAAPYRAVEDGAVDVALGLAALHALLLALDLIDVAWGLLSIGLAAACLALLVVLAGRWWRGRPAGLEDGVRPRSPAAGWGDGVALAVAGWLVLICHTGVATTPDFVYQWGIKAHRFLLAGTVDWGYLASPLGHAPSPDYPNLVPDLFVVTSLLRGGFSEPAAALWAPVFVLMAWAGVRATCASYEVSAGRGQAIVAVASLLVGMFTVGYRLAGGADPAIAAALLLALPALLRRAGGAGDLAVGAAAALAAGSKQEGVVLAVVLIVGYTLARGRRLWSEPRGVKVAYLLRVGAMPVAVAVPWALQVLRYDLLGATHPGGPVRWADLGEVLRAVAASLQVQEWHGLGWLVLLVPLLLVPRRTRLVGAVLSLQALTYLIVYLRHPGEEVSTYVMINAPRLVFHLVPAALAAALVVLGSGERSGETGGGPRERRPRPSRRAVVWAVLAVLGPWTAIAFASEQWRALDALRARHGSGVVARWRLGEERPESLRRFLADVDRATYPGSVLAFDPELEPAEERFYLTLWAAYFLPGKEVIAASRPDALREAHYLVTYNHHRAPPGAERVVLHPSGSVYWLGGPDP